MPANGFRNRIDRIVVRLSVQDDGVAIVFLRIPQALKISRQFVHVSRQLMWITDEQRTSLGEKLNCIVAEVVQATTGVARQIMVTGIKRIEVSQPDKSMVAGPLREAAAGPASKSSW